MFRLHLTPGWTRFLYGIPEPIPPSRRGVPRRNPLYSVGRSQPKTTPCLRLGWRPWKLAVLVSQLPPAYRAEALDGLRCTLDFRARSEEPPRRPKDAPLDKVERTRFGLLGKRLQDSIPDDLPRRSAWNCAKSSGRWRRFRCGWCATIIWQCTAPGWAN
jgi:hypothetical protein